MKLELEKFKLMISKLLMNLKFLTEFYISEQDIKDIVLEDERFAFLLTLLALETKQELHRLKMLLSLVQK